MSDKSVRKLLAAVLAAAASLNGASHVQALPTMPIHDPHMTNQDVWATIDGKLTVEAGKIAGEASDPGMLLRGQAKKYLERKFSEYLDPTKSLEQLIKNEH